MKTWGKSDVQVLLGKPSLSKDVAILFKATDLDPPAQ